MFDYSYLNIMEEVDRMLGGYYPGIDRQAEYGKLAAKLEADPDRKPRKRACDCISDRAAARRNSGSWTCGRHWLSNLLN